MLAPAAMKLDDVNTVLEDMEVKAWPGVYVLGCLDRRVTVYSQQVRALNLAAALFADGKVEKDEEVIVVGAGAAGLTCAAGLRHLGAKVTVLEEQEEILSIFGGTSQRWLHPGVYDWPKPGWSRDRTGLPLLDWGHGVVANVRAELETAWRAIEALGRVKVVPKAQKVDLGEPADKPRTVTWWEPGNEERTVRTVVLAVGFGLEHPQSYWDADDLERKVEGKRRKWIVSGCGDGALTDLLRLCIEGFRHDQMLHEFVEHPRMHAVEQEILRIESTPTIVNDPKELHAAYMKLNAPWVQEKMKPRSDTEVVLNAPTAAFLTNGASALNRFLVAQLSHAKRFRLVRGNLREPGDPGERETVAR